jgi:hypothetical protein
VSGAVGGAHIEAENFVWRINHIMLAAVHKHLAETGMRPSAWIEQFPKDRQERIRAWYGGMSYVDFTLAEVAAIAWHCNRDVELHLEQRPLTWKTP